MTDDATEMGPIDYLVVEFAEDRMTGESLPLLVDLVDREIIRILDLVFIRMAADGSATSLTIAELNGEAGVDLTVFEGAWSGLVAQDDIDEVGRVLQPGRVAVIVMYENVWASPLVGALRRRGAHVVATGRIPFDAVLRALDAAESAA